MVSWERLRTGNSRACAVGLLKRKWSSDYCTYLRCRFCKCACKQYRSCEKISCSRQLVSSTPAIARHKEVRNVPSVPSLSPKKHRSTRRSALTNDETVFTSTGRSHGTHFSEKHEQICLVFYVQYHGELIWPMKSCLSVDFEVF